eukprot:62250_1
MEYMRRNGRTLNPCEWSMGTLLEYKRNIWMVVWLPTNDGRLVVGDQEHGSFVDLFGCQRVDLSRGSVVNQNVWNVSGPILYFCQNDFVFELDVRSNTLDAMIERIRLREVYYIAFRYAARAFSDRRVGDDYEVTFTLPNYALAYIAEKYHLIPQARTRFRRLEYTLHVPTNESLVLIFGDRYFQKYSQSSGNTYYVEPITLNFSVQHRAMQVQGTILKEDKDGYVHGL